MCQALSLMGPVKVGQPSRNGESILIPTRLFGICGDCGSTHDLVLSVNLPCAVARRGQDKAIEHIGQQLRVSCASPDHVLGPISSLKWCEAVIAHVEKTNLQHLAGTMFLFDMPTQGHA